MRNERAKREEKRTEKQIKRKNNLTHSENESHKIFHHKFGHFQKILKNWPQKLVAIR